jgi:hypothetical protein
MTNTQSVITDPVRKWIKQTALGNFNIVINSSCKSLLSIGLHDIHRQLLLYKTDPTSSAIHDKCVAVTCLHEVFKFLFQRNGEKLGMNICMRKIYQKILLWCIFHHTYWILFSVIWIIMGSLVIHDAFIQLLELFWCVLFLCVTYSREGKVVSILVSFLRL